MQSKIPISNSEVHVWWMQVPEVSLQTLTPCLGMLDREEQSTYAKYKIDSKKVEFMLGRCLVKGLLGAYTGTAPADIHFIKNLYGKPLLAAGNNELCFNISHSHELIACAISLNNVGIDVERADKGRFEIMPFVFQQPEIDWVDTQPDTLARLRAFYTIWTRKEAVIKAVGKGFTIPPDTFTVPVDGHSAMTDQFVFFTFEPLPRYHTTVAAQRPSGNKLNYRIGEVRLTQLFRLLGRSCSNPNEDYSQWH